MIKAFNEVIAYTGAGIRELAKLKQAFFFLFIVAIIAIPASATPMGGVWQWYRYVLYLLVGAIVNIYFVQTILKKYCSISVDRRSIALCLVWSVLPSILGFIVFVLLSHAGAKSPTSIMPKHEFWESQEYYFVSIVTTIITAVIVSSLWFYPFCILENSKNPIQQSFDIVKKHYFSLVLISFVLWTTHNILVHVLISYIEVLGSEAKDLQSYKEYKYFYVLVRLEMISIWAIISAAISTSAYVKITKSNAGKTSGLTA